jgi:hypothetical protein
MTRSYLSTTRPKRRVARRHRDPAITSHGFSCWRLMPTGEPAEPFETIEVLHGTNTMFAFVGSRI